MRVMRWFLVSFGFTLSLIGWFLINSGFGFYEKLINKLFQLLTKRWVALEVSKCLSLEIQACLCSDIGAVYTISVNILMNINYVFFEYRVFVNEWLFIGTFTVKYVLSLFVIPVELHSCWQCRINNCMLIWCLCLPHMCYLICLCHIISFIYSFIRWTNRGDSAIKYWKLKGLFNHHTCCHNVNFINMIIRLDFNDL